MPSATSLTWGVENDRKLLLTIWKTHKIDFEKVATEFGGGADKLKLQDHLQKLRKKMSNSDGSATATLEDTTSNSSPAKSKATNKKRARNQDAESSNESDDESTAIQVKRQRRLKSQGPKRGDIEVKKLMAKLADKGATQDGSDGLGGPGEAAKSPRLKHERQEKSEEDHVYDDEDEGDEDDDSDWNPCV